MRNNTNVNPDGSLNLELLKNQILTKNGERYLNDVLIGPNYLSPAKKKKAEAKKDLEQLAYGDDLQGAVFLVYDEVGKDGKIREVTVFERAPSKAMQGVRICPSFENYRVAPENRTYRNLSSYQVKIHDIINGGDAVYNTVIAKDIDLRIPKNSFRNGKRVCSRAGSSNKIVLTAKLIHAGRNPDYQALAEAIDAAADEAGWPGTLTSILAMGVNLEIAFSHKAISLQKDRALQQAVTNHLVYILNQSEMPYHVEFKSTDELYRMHVPGAWCKSFRCQANLVYLAEETSRESLETAFRTMHLSNREVDKARDFFVRDYMGGKNQDKYYIPFSLIESLQGHANRDAFLDMLKKCEFNHIFTDKDVMKLVRVYGYWCFQTKKTYSAYARKAVVYNVMTMLHKLQKTGHIEAENVPSKEDVAEEIARISNEGHVFPYNDEERGKEKNHLGLDGENWKVFVSVRSYNEQRNRATETKLQRQKVQNKTRDRNSALRKESTRIYQEEAVKLWRAGVPAEKIAEDFEGIFRYLPKTLAKKLEIWDEELALKEKKQAECKAPVMAEVCPEKAAEKESEKDDFEMKKAEKSSECVYSCYSLEQENNKILSSQGEGTAKGAQPAEESLICGELPTDDCGQTAPQSDFIHASMPVYHGLLEFLRSYAPSYAKDLLDQSTEYDYLKFQCSVDQVFEKTVSLVYLFLQEVLPSAIRAYDYANHEDAHTGKNGREYTFSSYMTSGAFWRDFPVAAFLEAGIREVRKVLLDNGIPVKQSIYLHWLRNSRCEKFPWKLDGMDEHRHHRSPKNYSFEEYCAARFVDCLDDSIGYTLAEDGSLDEATRALSKLRSSSDFCCMDKEKAVYSKEKDAGSASENENRPAPCAAVPADPAVWGVPESTDGLDGSNC